MRPLVLWTVLALSMFAAPATAQAPPDEAPGAGSAPENLEAIGEAREFFQHGMEQYEQHHFREAIRAFSMAAERVPSADLWFNIARAHEQLNEYRPAIEYYQRYLRDRVDPPDRDQIELLIRSLQERAEAARQARQQRPTTGTLRVNSNREGAAIELDGRPVGTSPLRVPLTLRAGRHELRVTREGDVPFRARVNIEAGVTTAAFADMEPLTKYRAIHGTRLFTWIVGGLAVATLGASLYVGAAAAGDRADAGDLPIGDPNRDPLFQDALDTASVSDYLLGGAIALVVGAVVLYFIEGRAVATERVSGASP